MPKPTSVFACSACGAQTPKWHGQCPSCGEWNTLVEERAPRRSARAAPPAAGPAGAPVAAARGQRRARAAPAHGDRRARHGPRRRARARVARPARRLAGDRQVDADEHGPRPPRRGRARHALRLRRGVGGADPPAGRAPGARRARGPRAGRDRPRRGARRARGRAARRVRHRLGADAALERARVARRARSARCARWRRGSARVAKRQGTAVLLVGHVTKEGALAGPRVLEHLVDCVLQFEGERERTYRTLRALKNRFGSTNEVGVFEMREGGLVEVLDASARFVGEATKAPGLVVLAAMEGSRPLLVEVQALVSPERARAARAGCATGSTATGWRSCSPSWAATRASAWAPATSSSTSWAACASTSPGPTWPSRWPSPARRAGRRRPSHRRWPASARSGSRASCARVAHPDRRAQEAAKFGLRTVVVAGRARRRCASAIGQRLVKWPAGVRARLDTALTSLSVATKNAARIGLDGAAFRG